MNGLAARRGLSIALLVSILSGLVPLTLAPAPAFAANPSVDLKAVTFLDASTGFAAGANGVIAKTTDGGDNWTVVRSGSEDFRGIVFWNSLQGLAVTYDRKAFGTNDGGATWQLLTAEMTAEPYLEYIGIDRIAAPPGPTDRLAFAAGGYSPMSGLSYVPEQVYRTYGNGGAYWGIPGGSPAPVLRPCRYPDPSGDTGGDNVGRGEFFGIDFVDASRGWAVGVDYFPSTPTATVYATADGGNTWSQQSVGAPVALRDVSFATTATGVAVSAQGRVFYTRNGGATWQEGVSGTTSALYAVEMIDSSTAWAVGAAGKIIKTTDGGATWAAVTSPTTNDLLDITSFGTRAWAVGRYGTVVLTTDGSTWRRAQPDSTPPVITSLSSPTHPSADAWYKNTDPAFSWIASDASGVSGFSYVLDASPDTVPDTSIDSTQSSVAFSGKPTGEWWFHLRAVDAYGNWSGASHLKVRIDALPPVTTDDASSLYPGPATITLSPADAHSGVALTRWTLDGTPGTGTVVSASSDGTHTLAYASVDAAGNEEATKTVQFVIDTVLPVVTDLTSATHPDANAWYRSLSASFTWGSSSNVGVVGYSYELSPDAGCVPDQVVDTVSGEATVTVPGEGVWYFCVRAKDVLDRWGSAQRRAVHVDRTPPVTTDDSSALSTSTPVVVTLSPADALSGVALTRWTLDGTPGTGTVVSASSDGTHTLSYASVDAAGNEEATKTVQFVIDSTPPVITSLSSSTHPGIDAWYTDQDPSFAWSASDSFGVAGFSYAFDAVADTVPDEVVDTVASTLSLSGVETGEWWLHLRAVDTHGNWSPAYHRRVRIDVTPPSTWALLFSPYKDSATIALSADDGIGSGVASTWWSLNGWPRQSGTTVNVTRPGRYVLECASRDNVGNEATPKTAAFDVVASFSTLEPIQGDDRFLTAVAASKEAYPISGSAAGVVIAYGRNWPDALGGAALAGAIGGPLLLTEKDVLPDAVKTEIARLKGSCTQFKVYVVGGSGVVSNAVYNTLKSSYDTTRVSGANRYLTANAVASEVIRLQGSSYDGKAFFATGENFPDALAASPVAAAKRWPVYLVNPATTAVDIDPKVTSGVILGGTAVVSSGYESALKSRLGAGAVERIEGMNRYETAVKVSATAVAEWGFLWDSVALTNGKNYPDALAGGALQGRSHSVMLLTDPAVLSPETGTALRDNRDWIGTLRFLGGTGAVSQAVRDVALGLLHH
ncbi:cell wall-binding repeat-containing protein [Coriobacteriia bacterium Es71-Z0120]|uniref:cell wall-binding repeat-containing protein n=1 Tax=Parvivirga hydrogeniphila TaxID=2939460 RepID=UPI002260C603|nr:cell wall-binding repeat-containing protein [Parvivirga hydrogeniphila]MCL4079377.1 cell wall-binding repeat-containing protein [Parvivirga hydrogeniphila]